MTTKRKRAEQAWRDAQEKRAALAEARAEEAWRTLVAHQAKEIERQHELLRGPGTYLEPALPPAAMAPGFWSEDGLVYIEDDDGSDS